MFDPVLSVLFLAYLAAEVLLSGCVLRQNTSGDINRSQLHDRDASSVIHPNRVRLRHACRGPWLGGQLRSRP